MCVYYVFLRQLSVDGHLDCFHVLAAVDNAVLNTEVCVSFQIRVYTFFLTIYLGERLLVHMVVLCLIF